MNKRFSILICCLCMLLAACGGKSDINQEMVDDSRPLHDESFYQGLLDAFLQDSENFKKVYGNKLNYKHDKLKVITVSRRTSNSDNISGDLTFWYECKSSYCGDGDFKAYVIDKGVNDEYLVCFDRCHGRNKKKREKTEEISFIYRP